MFCTIWVYLIWLLLSCRSYFKSKLYFYNLILLIVLYLTANRQSAFQFTFFILWYIFFSGFKTSVWFKSDGLDSFQENGSPRIPNDHRCKSIQSSSDWHLYRDGSGLLQDDSALFSEQVCSLNCPMRRWTSSAMAFVVNRSQPIWSLMGDIGLMRQTAFSKVPVEGISVGNIVYIAPVQL